MSGSNPCVQIRDSISRPGFSKNCCGVPLPAKTSVGIALVKLTKLRVKSAEPLFNAAEFEQQLDARGIKIWKRDPSDVFCRSQAHARPLDPHVDAIKIRSGPGCDFIQGRSRWTRLFSPAQPEAGVQNIPLQGRMYESYRIVLFQAYACVGNDRESGSTFRTNGRQSGQLDGPGWPLGSGRTANPPIKMAKARTKQERRAGHYPQTSLRH